MTILELLVKLLGDEEALAEFKDNPDEFLKSCGIEQVSTQDVEEAIVLLDDQDSDSDRKYDTGDNHIKATPPPVKHSGESDHEHAVRYINTYVTENHIDDRDTITDNSINQLIDTAGGDFDQDIDIDSVVASGDGAVGVGGDIDGSTITTGSGNVVGEGNEVVNGNRNTTAFDEGQANSTDVGGDLRLGDGSAFATGGSTRVDNTDNSWDNVGNTDIDASIDDSGNDSSDRSSVVDYTDTSDNSYEERVSTDNDENTDIRYSVREESEIENSFNSV
jgi:hypothetical protein